MRTIKHSVTWLEDREYTLYFLTDLHLGARNCDEQLLKQDILKIANDPNALWIGGGDYLDCISRRGDKRYRESAYAPWVHGIEDVIDAQEQQLFSFLRPIMDKCIALLRGNHEDSALQWYDRDVYWNICRTIAIDKGVMPEKLALGTNGFVVLKWQKQGKKSKKWEVPIYCHHGYGGGRKSGGHALALSDLLTSFDCDIALLGHRHTRHVLDKRITMPDGKYKDRIAMFVPSYLGRVHEQEGRPFDDYAERIGLPAQHLGTVPILFNPSEQEFSLVIRSGSGL